MVLDQSVDDVHHFEDIDLVAVRCCARILPDEESLSVREPGAIALRQLATGCLTAHFPLKILAFRVV